MNHIRRKIGRNFEKEMPVVFVALKKLYEMGGMIKDPDTGEDPENPVDPENPDGDGGVTDEDLLDSLHYGDDGSVTL